MGANWTIISESLDLTAALSSGGLTQLTDAQQNAVLIGDPTKTVADGTVKLSDLYNFAADKNGDGDATDADELLGYIAESDYSDPNGSDVFKEITYYNAAGEIVGRANFNSFTFDDTWSSTSTVSKTQTSTFYNDADYNFIGDSSSDGTFSRKFFNVKVDATTKAEVGSEGDSQWSRDWVFNYDIDNQGNESFAGGSETENGITYQLDANWSRSGGQADVLPSSCKSMSTNKVMQNTSILLQMELSSERQIHLRISGPAIRLSIIMMPILTGWAKLATAEPRILQQMEIRKKALLIVNLQRRSS